MKIPCMHLMLILSLCTSPASAQTYYLLQTVTGTGGGSYSTSTHYTMGSTEGQPATGSPASSGYADGQGFWPEDNSLQSYFNGNVPFLVEIQHLMRTLNSLV